MPLSPPLSGSLDRSHIVGLLAKKGILLLLPAKSMCFYLLLANFFVCAFIANFKTA